MNTKTLRGLCLGAGYFSQFHLDAWRRIPEVEIVAVCDTDAEKARSQAAAFSVPSTFNDAARAIAELELDFVDIITRPDTHQPLVELAAARGLAIICQKPLAPDFAAARAIVAAADKARVPFMVHENFRFQPWYRELKQLIDCGAIGTKLHSLTVRSRPGDGWGADAYLSRQPYFRDMPRLLVHETGVHFIDTFRFLGGEIQEVYAILRRLNPAIAGEDACLLTFRFAGGAVGMWDANRFNEGTAADPRWTFGQCLVEGNAGSLRLYDDGRITIQPLGEPEREHPYHAPRQGFAGDCVLATQRHFVERLLAGISFETSGDEYLKTLAVQEAVYLSAKENRPVRVAEIDAARASADGSAKGAPAAISPRSGPVRTGGRATGRVVDLTRPIDANLPNATVTQFKTIAVEGWNATMLSLYSHCGTHMDAPKHFVEGGASLDQQRLDVCCGPAKVLNLAPAQPRELLDVARLAPWADSIEPGDRLLLRTDWHRTFGTDAYRNALPRISVELARWLVEKQVALVGVEPPSVCDVNDLRELTEVHQTLFHGNVLIVEGLVNLDQIRGDVVEFIALPLKIVGGDGCPVRAIAIEMGVS